MKKLKMTQKYSSVDTLLHAQTSLLISVAKTFLISFLLYNFILFTLYRQFLFKYTYNYKKVPPKVKILNMKFSKLPFPSHKCENVIYMWCGKV